jgi:hypothetical protein
MQDGSVFADFDIDEDGRIFLSRISFDGYGCCESAANVRPMSVINSKLFINSIESGDISSEKLFNIISGYFRENSDVIWKDALEEHNLIY